MDWFQWIVAWIVASLIGFKNWFWQFVQSIGYLTQAVHFFAAWAVTFTGGTIWFEPIWAAIFFEVYAVIKECFVDNFKWGEGHGSPDWWDLFWYSVGNAFALFLLHLGGRLQ